MRAVFLEEGDSICICLPILYLHLSETVIHSSCASLRYSAGIRKVDTLCQPVGGRPQVKCRFYRGQEAFVIAGILDFCPVLLFVKRQSDNNYRNNDNSRTVGY